MRDGGRGFWFWWRPAVSEMGSGMSSFRRPRGFVFDPMKGMIPLLGLQVALQYGRPSRRRCSPPTCWSSSGPGPSTGSCPGSTRLPSTTNSSSGYVSAPTYAQRNQMVEFCVRFCQEFHYSYHGSAVFSPVLGLVKIECFINAMQFEHWLCNPGKLNRGFTLSDRGLAE